MNKTLYELFRMGQDGDEKAKLELYKKFLPRIKRFGRKLYYEEAETDLTIFLLEFINKVNLEKFQNRKDEEIDSYMYKVFKNKYINILRQVLNKNIETTILETDFICYDCYEKLEEKYIFDLMKNLNDIQKKIIIGKYIYGNSDNELSILLNVSRQTIYKQKKNALIILKDEIEGDIDYGRKVIWLTTTQGIWALLSIVLIFYILKTQEKRDARQEERESNYQTIISSLSENLNIVEDIKNDISEIKNSIKK